MTDRQVALLLADLALIVVLAKGIGLLARTLRQPAVIGEIIAGILVGPTLLHGAIATTLFPIDVRPYLTTLADLGLALFMFVIGLEFDHATLRGHGKVTGATALGSSLIPFGLGTLLALYLVNHQPSTNRVGFVLFIGTAIAVTAFPVLARIIVDLNMTNTLSANIALSAAAVCDIAAWSMLALVQVIVGNHDQPHWLVLLLIPYLALMFLAIRPLLRRVLASDELTPKNFAIVLAGLLISAAATQLIGLHFIFGAFLFGLIMPRTSTGELRHELVRRTQIGTTLLLPIYFVVTGLNVDLSTIGPSGLIDLGLIILTAIIGKFSGTFLGARSQGLPTHQSVTLATLMNTRGLTELVALTVGLHIGILDQQLYSLMVVMAVVTTAMSGPILLWLRRRHATDPEPVEPITEHLKVS